MTTGDTVEDEEAGVAGSRHNRFHPETHRVMITFRGSSPEDMELYKRLQERLKANGEKFSRVVRAELWRYVRRGQR